MDPSDYLLAARDLIRENGWTRWEYRDPDTGAMCLSGALSTAIPVDTTVFMVTRRSLVTEIADRYGTSEVVRVNDEIISSADEACDILEAAAKRAAEEGL